MSGSAFHSKYSASSGLALAGCRDSEAMCEDGDVIVRARARASMISVEAVFDVTMRVTF